MKRLDRGVTSFYARGMYTKRDKDVLMTIVSPRDARELTPRIRELDPNAFLIVENVHEVLGEGFRSREEVDLKFLKSVQKREAAEAASKAAQAAIRAELAAQIADQKASEAREEAEKSADLPGVDFIREKVQNAEEAALEAAKLAKKAREHAIELEAAASSIEQCLDEADIQSSSSV